jgi:hypothetical protein
MRRRALPGVRSMKWLGKRLPRDLSRYSLKVGKGMESRAWQREVLLEARRLGWLRKPVMDD